MSNSHQLLTKAVVASAIAMPLAAQAQQKPNIVFFYADDLGYSDLSCYGSKLNETPNLDKLADEGIRFTDFYAASPVSSPSRAALLTGRYPSRIGINHVFFTNGFTGLPLSEITIAELLKQQGYSTAIYGKWHLGSDPEYLPVHQGFDEFYGTFGSIDMAPFVYVNGDKPESKIANKDSTTITYTNKAIDFIDRKKDGPFFLYVPFNMPHVPIAASPRFRGKSKNGLYSDVIAELDWGIGEIVKHIDELGLSENTIICFASDNGPWLSEGPYGGKADPLYRGKGTTWDGGQRVPMIVRWKGHIKPHQINKDVAVMTDWFQTFADVAGVNVPTDRVYDGYDILPVLLNKGKRPNQDFAYINFGKLEAFRSGDWKIKLPEPKIIGNYWETDVPAHDTLLINLRSDISEQHNVKKEHPEIVKKLVSKIDSLKKTGVYGKRIFLTEFDTEALTEQQRIQNVLDAEKKGIGPKSERGKQQEEYYKAILKYQQEGQKLNAFTQEYSDVFK